MSQEKPLLSDFLEELKTYKEGAFLDKTISIFYNDWSLNPYDEDDYSELLRGKEVRDLITKTATRYYLQDCVCSSCSHNIKYVSINPKQIFFFKIGEGRNKRMMG